MKPLSDSLRAGVWVVGGAGGVYLLGIALLIVDVWIGSPVLTSLPQAVLGALDVVYGSLFEEIVINWPWLFPRP